MNKYLIPTILIVYIILDNVTGLVSETATTQILLLSLSGYALLFGILNKNKIIKTDKTYIYIYLFIFFGIFSSLYHRSFFLIFDVFLLTIPFLVLQNNYKVNVNFLSTIFVIQIIISISSYYLGYNEYGFFPGQSTRNLWWRVSLFPFKSPPYTSYFASIFLLIFLFNKKNKYSYILIGLATYWVIFSGSRTIYIFWFALFFFELFKNRFEKVKIALPYLLLIIILSILFFIEVLLPITQGSDVLSTLARTQQGPDEISTDLSRLYLYSEFTRIFLENPLFGSGILNLDKLFPNSHMGTETKFIKLFATIGMSAIFYYTYFLKRKVYFVHKKYMFQYWVTVLFMLALMLYSSYIVPYNFVTVFSIILITSKYEETKVSNEMVFKLGLEPETDKF